MARIRTIKPEFFKHYELWQAEAETGLPLRVAFAGLWCVADREGRFRWLPPQIKIDVLPYDEIDFSRVLDALTTRGFVVKYAVNGREYGAIPGFTRHQVVNNRERKSEIPEPNKNNILSGAQRDDDASSTREPRVPQGREGKGTSIPPSEGAASAPEKVVSLEVEAYRFGKKVLGKGAGGLVTKLRKHCNGDFGAVMDLLEEASGKEDAKEWVSAVLRGEREQSTADVVAEIDRQYCEWGVDY